MKKVLPEYIKVEKQKQQKKEFRSVNTGLYRVTKDKEFCFFR